MTAQGRPRRWIGRLIIAVAAVHFFFGFVFWTDDWLAMLADGGIASANDIGDREVAYWFAALSPFLAMIGAMVDRFEADGRPMPGFLAPALLVTIAILGLLMPVNGIWLLLVPTIGLFQRARKLTNTV